jgi:hypothetical protein
MTPSKTSSEKKNCYLLVMIIHYLRAEQIYLHICKFKDIIDKLSCISFKENVFLQ